MERGSRNMNNIEKEGNNTNAITISRKCYYDLTRLISQDMPERSLELKQQRAS